MEVRDEMETNAKKIWGGRSNEVESALALFYSMKYSIQMTRDGFYGYSALTLDK